jgi:hypothetical protein
VPAGTPFGNVDFRAYNIDFINDFKNYATGPALAVSVSYANSGFYFCGFYSYQDTVSTSSVRSERHASSLTRSRCISESLVMHTSTRTRSQDKRIFCMGLVQRGSSPLSSRFAIVVAASPRGKVPTQLS